MSRAGAASAQLAEAPLPEFLSHVIQAAGSSDIEVVQSIAAFVNQSQRDEYVASARAGDGKVGAALAAEYTSAACCTFQAAWEAFRKDRSGSNVRVLVFEGIIGQTGGRSGAHAVGVGGAKARTSSVLGYQTLGKKATPNASASNGCAGS